MSIYFGIDVAPVRNIETSIRELETLREYDSGMATTAGDTLHASKDTSIFGMETHTLGAIGTQHWSLSLWRRLGR